MVRVIKQSYHTARKDYHCDACEWIHNNDGFRQMKLTFSEWRSVVRAKKNNWKIKKGEKYLYQFNRYSSDVYSLKMIPEIHKICYKYKLYEF